MVAVAGWMVIEMVRMRVRGLRKPFQVRGESMVSYSRANCTDFSGHSGHPYILSV